MPALDSARNRRFVMAPSVAERNVLFQAFAKALFKGDMDALYQVVSLDFMWSFHDGLSVTKSLGSAEAIAAHIAEQKTLFLAQRFHDVVYHHLPDRSFMTFCISETVRETGEMREQRGVEQYTFIDGKIATKDVYRKPALELSSQQP
jgi:ketosteroid isomerase-like protein